MWIFEYFQYIQICLKYVFKYSILSYMSPKKKVGDLPNFFNWQNAVSKKLFLDVVTKLRSVFRTQLNIEDEVFLQK